MAISESIAFGGTAGPWIGGMSHEAAMAGFTLNHLNDGLPSTLNGSSFTGIGDVTWAFQWDVTIPGDKSFLVMKNLNIALIPEPLTMTGAMVAVVCLTGYLRRRIMAL